MDSEADSEVDHHLELDLSAPGSAARVNRATLDYTASAFAPTNDLSLTNSAAHLSGPPPSLATWQSCPWRYPPRQRVLHVLVQL